MQGADKTHSLDTLVGMAQASLEVTEVARLFFEDCQNLGLIGIPGIPVTYCSRKSGEFIAQSFFAITFYFVIMSIWI